MIKVIDPGFYTSIQDLGRFGAQNFGVPISGCMDQCSADIANKIIGNNSLEALIELTMTGCCLKFENNTTIAITGSDMSPKLNGLSIDMFSVIEVKYGDILSFGRIKYGFRTYIAFRGGINSEKVMESKSMYVGLTKNFKINKNDVIYLNDSNPLLNKKHEPSLKKLILSDEIECYKGPEYSKLTAQNKQKLLSTQFSISNNHNRMGYVLYQKIKNTIKPIITSHVMPGTVQLTPGGDIIILMRDSQTTGGYPRILQLTNKGIDFVAQKKTGSLIKFSINN
ncbi:MAG TPA: biotin-dependent carboxyltransferase family protein [Flavobacteriaceae bacterium]|nr:biotin-dependent carboxyltransferase family protein [Flavobacteriaceae bacterium]